jgi:predicted SAM-dependent methyltransferase
MAIDSRIPKASAGELVERLRHHPELQAHIEEYLDVVENSAGDVAKADEAEHRLIELMRQMGQSAMQAWADRKRAKVEEESDKRSDLVRREKKGSTGTRRSET